MQFPFVGPAYVARGSQFDCEDLFNLYPEKGNPNSKSISALIGTPGLRIWQTLAGGGIRGLKIFNQQLAIGVAGGNVYLLRSDGTNALLGAIAFGLTPVSIASNGIVMVIVTGAQGYIVNPTLATLQQINDADFLGADTVDFCDGYFVFNIPGTGKFQVSQIYSTDIDALSFATAEGSPDLLLSLLVNYREVWLFGETTTEVFFDTGDTVNFPFQRIPGAFIEQGCAAKFSPAKLDNTVYWLSADERGKGNVQRANGYQAEKASTYAVDYDIARLSRIDDAVAFSYQQEGHAFYVLIFPTANRVWVFDSHERLWHKRAWRDPVDGSYKRIRPQTQMQFAGLTIVGDWENSNLYVYDLDTYSDNGDPLPRRRVCPVISDPDYKMMFFRSLQIDMEKGVGLNTGQGVDPKMSLRWSNDGGKTFENEEELTLGAMGEYRARARKTKLGRARARVYEVTITDPVKVVLLGASSDHYVGTK